MGVICRLRTSISYSAVWFVPVHAHTAGNRNPHARGAAGKRSQHSVLQEGVAPVHWPGRRDAARVSRLCQAQSGGIFRDRWASRARASFRVSGDRLLALPQAPVHSGWRSLGWGSQPPSHQPRSLRDFLVRSQDGAGLEVQAKAPLCGGPCPPLSAPGASAGQPAPQACRHDVLLASESPDLGVGLGGSRRRAGDGGRHGTGHGTGVRSAVHLGQVAQSPGAPFCASKERNNVLPLPTSEGTRRLQRPLELCAAGQRHPLSGACVLLCYQAPTLILLA